MTTEREARMALAAVVEPGDADMMALIAREGPEQVWQHLASDVGKSRWSRRARQLRLLDVEEATTRCGARFIIPGDEEWPGTLDGLAGAEPLNGMAGTPVGLWVRGRRRLSDSTGAVAVVGARAATRYGEELAVELGGDLAARGWTVVSGGAHGIDAASHRGALMAETDAQLPTVAVLASAVDRCYPAGNAGLLEQIVERGVVVSEYAPGSHPTRPRFLARNRLIAALGVGTVIVEAALRSGARNTVAWAHRCGRDVMAFPGPVHSTMSSTPHALIREQAASLVTSARDVLQVVSPLGEAMVPLLGRAAPRPLDPLEGDLSIVFEALPARGGLGAAEVAAVTGLALPAVLVALVELADRGHVAERDGRWRAQPPH